MSCKLISVNGVPIAHLYKEFLLETEDEIQKLPRYGVRGTFESADNNDDINSPCAFGSTAIVCKEGQETCVYILSPSNVWVKM